MFGGDGAADPRVNLFFRTEPMAEAVASTWLRYAYALVVWLNFLHALGRTWDHARHQNMPSHTGNYRRGVRDVFSSSAHTPTWAARARIGWRFSHYPSYIRQLSQARKSRT
jgi:hypothetical protein